MYTDLDCKTGLLYNVSLQSDNIDRITKPQNSVTYDISYELNIYISLDDYDTNLPIVDSKWFWKHLFLDQSYRFEPNTWK